MRFIIFLVITGALTMSAGAAYFFFGQPKEDPLAIEMKAFEREIKTVTPAARRGDVRAQYRLGHVYGDANPAFRDYKSALKWYRKAADQGHIGAQYATGNFHANGLGTGQNYHRASEWFLLAGGLGRHRDAQFALGDLYFHGRGVPHSYG